jgi:hypothetical protein
MSALRPAEGAGGKTQLESAVIHGHNQTGSLTGRNARIGGQLDGR